MLSLIHSKSISSKEIADLVEKPHDDVKRSIERLYSFQYENDGAVKRQPVIACPPMEEVQTSGGNNRTYTASVYIFAGEQGKRDSIIVVAQLSPEFTARLVDRWQELESSAAPRLPQTYAEALRELADTSELAERQRLQLEEQKPAVEFLDRFVQAKSDKGFREVAKILGIKEREFIKMLVDDMIVFRQGSSLLPFAHYQHSGYFTVKTGESSGHSFIQARFTPAGLAWIAKRVSHGVGAITGEQR